MSQAERPDQQQRITELLEAVGIYRRARVALIETLGCGGSNRDPLAEFSEQLVAAWLGGDLAASRVQKGWDLKDPEGRTVEVRYLANPSDTWVNEHRVHFSDDLDRYALVVFEAFQPRAALCFSRATLGDVCRHLGKRHPGQDRSLQLTRANFRQLLREQETFERLGVNMLTLDATP